MLSLNTVASAWATFASACADLADSLTLTQARAARAWSEGWDLLEPLGGAWETRYHVENESLWSWGLIPQGDSSKSWCFARSVAKLRHVQEGQRTGCQVWYADDVSRQVCALEDLRHDMERDFRHGVWASDWKRKAERESPLPVTWNAEYLRLTREEVAEADYWARTYTGLDMDSFAVESDWDLSDWDENGAIYQEEGEVSAPWGEREAGVYAPYQGGKALPFLRGIRERTMREIENDFSQWEDWASWANAQDL